MSKKSGNAHKELYQLGFWSSVLALIFSLGFLVIAVSGAFAASIIPFGSSLLLAWSFLVMMASIHRIASEESRIWSQIGLSFAILYVAMVSIVYFVNITVVAPLIQAGQTDKVAFLIFDWHGSFMLAIDGLGYGFMCLATLFAAFVFGGNRIAKFVKWSFIFNGVLVVPTLLFYSPLVVPQPYYTIVLPFAWLWSVSFPLSAIMTAIYFRKNAKAT